MGDKARKKRLFAPQRNRIHVAGATSMLLRGGLSDCTEMSGEVIGRDQELSALAAFLAGSADRPAAMVLEGEAGIGKSTLWLAGVAAARELGFRVHVSRPAEAERGLAYAGLSDLFEGVLEQVLPVLPEPRRRALEVARSCSPSTTSSGSTRRQRARSCSRFGGWTSSPSFSSSPVASVKVRRRRPSSGRSLPTG